MEAKKNPDKDIYRKSFQYFCIGLILSCTLIITAFEWSTEKKMIRARPEENPSHEINWVIPSTIIEPQPIEKVKMKPEKMVIQIPEYTVETNSTEPETETYTEPEHSQSTGTFSLTLPPEPLDTIVVFPEFQPEPMGGLKSFYEMMAKNIRYPRNAQRQGIEGKVFVEFVIDKKGLPSQFRVIKGIGAGCDEEAMRVIALSKWKPGKQRGNPVNVRMVIPIAFQLTK